MQRCCLLGYHGLGSVKGKCVIGAWFSQWGTGGGGGCIASRMGWVSRCGGRAGDSSIGGDVL